MFRSALSSATLCFVCLGLGLTALADEVRLKNGDRLTGTVVKSDGKSLTLKTEFAGTVNIVWDAVDQVTTSQPVYLNLNDGQTVVGAVAGGAGQYEVATKDAGKVSVAKTAIKAIRSEDEQKAYLAEIDRLQNPRLLDLWAGTFDAGYSLTRGNADTNTFTLGATATRASSRDKISLYATAIKARARSRTTGVEEETANAIRGGGRYDINLTKKVFAFGFSDLEFDEFQQLADCGFLLVGQVLLDHGRVGFLDDEHTQIQVARSQRLKTYTQLFGFVIRLHCLRKSFESVESN